MCQAINRIFLVSLNGQDMVSFYEKQDGKLLGIESLKANCWVNIAPPFNSVELDKLSEKLQVPLDFLTDPLDIDERTRFEIEDDVKKIIIEHLNEELSNGNNTIVSKEKFKIWVEKCLKEQS